MDLSWMSQLCNPRDPAPVAHRPATFELHGASWTVATEGHVLVAIREEAPSGFPPAPAEQRPVIAQFLTTPLAGGTPADLAALRTWCGEPQWPGEDPCPQCHGAGTVTCPACDGEHHRACTCSTCGDEHEADCQECHNGQADCRACDGTGRHGGTLPVRPGRIGPALINRELLARGLAHLPGEIATVAVPVPDAPLYVDGAGWRVVLMPMRDSFIRDAPEWPLAPCPPPP